MGLRGLVLVGLMGFLSLAAVVNPFAGIAAYLIHYHVYPEQAWWGAALSESGLRYSLTITLCLTAGACLNWGKLPYRSLLTRQEQLYFPFLAWLVLNRLFHGTVGPAEAAGLDPVEKMLKMTVFLFILTHVVVTERLFDRFARLLVLCGLYLGYEAYNAPPSAFVEGRLNGSVGGPDFTNSNALAAHCLFLAAVIGVHFLRSVNWKDKGLAIVAGALVADTIIMTRSRGGFLAGVVGLVAALWLAPKGKRAWVVGIMVCGLLGTFMLADTNFLLRMGTIELDANQQSEISAQSRLDIWEATAGLIRDNPWGVGPGNFAGRIGAYTNRYANMDTHNTFLRCLAELGWPGFFLFLALVGNAVWTLFRLVRLTAGQPHLDGCCYHCYAFLLAAVSYLVASLFGSYIYLETLWLILLVPSALQRAVENAQEACPVSDASPADEVALPAGQYPDQEPQGAAF